MSDKDLTRDQKIEKINAYRMLIKTNLPIRKVEDSLRQEIEGEFQAWIESRLNDLLGESKPEGSTGGFSSEDVEILQGLVKQIKSRKGTTAESVPASSTEDSAPAPLAPRKPNSMAPTLSDADKARLNAVARPIRPIKQPANRGEKSKQEDLLDHLDKMDREAPEF